MNDVKYQGDAIVEQSGSGYELTTPVWVSVESMTEMVWVGDAPMPGLRRWAGTIRATVNLHFGDALLRLPDGTNGRIVIHGRDTIDTTDMGSSWVHTALGAAYKFVGNGALLSPVLGGVT